MSFPASTSTFLALACAAVACAGCGGAQTKGVTPGEFTAEHGVLFDDGVDLIEDPEGLQGRWKSDYELELEQRAEAADLVVSGVVTTVRVEQDPEMRHTFHLLLRRDDVLKGETDEPEFALTSREGARGYGSVSQHRDRMLEQPFVAFIRYAEGEGGEAVAHFHLSRPSPTVISTLERRDAKDNPHRVKVIEHTQD